MARIVQRYKLNQCVFYKLKSKKQLAYFLKVDYETLREINELIHYKSFSLRTEGKKDRDITAPNKKLKDLQKRIHNLLLRIERPDWLISGERGKSYIDNGKMHQNCNYALCMDIKSFYRNTKREYVFRFFTEEMLMSKDTAKVVTDILTFQNSIPTGSPASQLIAYYAYHRMFHEIKSIATNKHSCIFSLYVDDMTFSSDTPFEVNVLRKEIDILLRKYDHKPSYSKTNYYSRNKAKPVTGTTISKNHELLIPNTLQMKIKRDSEMVLQKGRELSTKQRASFNGRVKAARIIEKLAFPELNKLAERMLN
ncbi:MULTISPECIES: reverse transcriptase family protein [Paenibacillus]|uniref:Reverse transcriptase (RNA-dependent DNA polymerase) n=1 Tax=Paenibacillus pabuli TaxID=1472 RepID=A0A855Y2H1_9BACL|nr:MULTISPECIES: reverse transcriptase family protein [Paenibacillus]PWW32927.1 reverse transcriptase (RNA-dependent DNA polymerase) [Paenibacillus pabuli]PXV98810.1 reverse transcriptase (RNA-dependent DNA polymerase) [Paenibacillus taichungensis]